MSNTNTLKVGDIVKVKDKVNGINATGKIISINPNNVTVQLYSKEIVLVTPDQLLKKAPNKKLSTVGSAESFGQHSPTGSAASFEEPASFGLTELSRQRRPTDSVASFEESVELTPRHQEIRSFLEGEVERLSIPALEIMRNRRYRKKGKPTEFSREQVFSRSRYVTSHNFTSLREDFRMCTRLVDFLNVSQEDILAIKSQLDFVESTAFLLYHNSYNDLDFVMELAFNIRSNFYHEHFVAPGAKHVGYENTENYLRIITTRDNLKRIEENASRLEKEMLSQVGLVRTGGKNRNSYFVNSVKMTQTNHSQMEILVKKFYRALHSSSFI